MTDLYRKGALALLREIQEHVGYAKTSPGVSYNMRKVIREKLEAALNDPVRRELEQVLSGMQGIGDDAYIVKLAGVNATEGIKRLGGLAPISVEDAAARLTSAS